VWIGHGAAGNAASMRPHVEGLRARGLDAAALSLPKGSAERAMPRLLEQVGDDHRHAVIGGQSYGGRVASMVAADVGDFAGLVLISYPLHRPGHPDEQRTEHWPRISCPTLLLSGEADSFARIDLLRAAVRRLPHAELHTYPGVGHGGLAAVLDDALDRIAEFVRSLS
jgi:predicted alpha/beta-hydrolase family hydrolase